MKITSLRLALLVALISGAMTVITTAQTTVTLNGSSVSNTNSTNYTTTGGLTMNLGLPVDLLAVGGGGGVGGAMVDSAWMGGGGGGQVATGTGVLATLLSNTVTVGNGGVANALGIGATGGSSTVLGITAAGGLGGGAAGTGRGGASGSGLNAGGIPATSPLNGRAGGGGGGQVASGSNGLNSEVGGAGGAGAMSAITGTNRMYGFGGGGAARLGSGANGDGSTGNPRANSGGGGNNSSAGAAGIVVIRYAGEQLATGGTVSTVGGDTVHTFTSSGSFALSNNLRATLSGTLSGAGNFAFTGPGTLTLSGANTYTGGTTVSAGTLQVGNGGTSGSLGSGAVTNNAAMIFNRSDDTTVANVISGTGSVVKSGAGNMTLSAISTYSGTTRVAGGGIIINGSIANSAVTVQSGAFLGGSGTVGSLTVEGGTVSPGNSPGTLNINGDIDWLGGGSYNWQIVATTGAAGTSWDLLSAAGQLDLAALTVSSKFNINLWTLGSGTDGALADFNPNQSYTWTILTATNGISGFAADKFNINTAGFANPLNGGSFSIAQSGNNLNLVYGPGAPIPEPGTWAAAALLVGGAALMRWRQRRGVVQKKSGHG